MASALEEQVPRAQKWGAIERALVLEWLTVGWNIVEGLVAMLAAAGSGSVALLGFGIDSFVESASGAVLIWRLRAGDGADPKDVEWIERRAQRLVAASLFLLAAYIAMEAVMHLVMRERPGVSGLGIVITALSIVAMWWLARAKRRAAAAVGSPALAADAFQTTTCFRLSIVTLGGIVLNAAFGWWWADPVAALGLVYFVSAEGREVWRGEACCRH